MKLKKLKSVLAWASQLPKDFATTLETNFNQLNTVPGPLAVTTQFTLQADDQIDSVQANATGGAFSVYLPASPTGNRRRRVIKVDSSANAVTVNGNGSLINGGSTYTLAAQYDKCDVEPTGTGWLIVN